MKNVNFSMDITSTQGWASVEIQPGSVVQRGLLSDRTKDVSETITLTNILLFVL